MPPADADLRRAREIAVGIAEEAGALLASRSAHPVGVRAKGTSGDVVTELDLAAEEVILGRLKAHFPGHQIVAEESGTHGATGTWTWLVDPLDGTNNVAIGLPAYVVGLALCADRRPVVGVVHDPVSGRTYSAIRGAGTTGPTGRLRAALRSTPHGPLLAWTQGHGVPRGDDRVLALKMVLERHAYRVLQLWAPLMCWVMLARGDIDGFVGYRAESLDLPAGSLIASEAGIDIRALDGQPFDERIGTTSWPSFVAGHPDRIAGLLELVATAQELHPGVCVHCSGASVVAS